MACSRRSREWRRLIEALTSRRRLVIRLRAPLIGSVTLRCCPRTGLLPFAFRLAALRQWTSGNKIRVMVSYRGPYRHLLQVVRLGALVSVVVSAAAVHAAAVADAVVPQVAAAGAHVALAPQVAVAVAHVALAPQDVAAVAHVALAPQVAVAVAHVAVVDAAAVAIAPDPVLYEPAAAVAAVELLRDAVVVVPVVVLALRRVHRAAAVAVA